MSELKPCPFCGADKTVDVHSIFPDKSECFLCGATAPHWNSRPIEDALRAENERLRKALEKIANHCRPQRGGEEMALDWIEHEAREALEVKG